MHCLHPTAACNVVKTRYTQNSGIWPDMFMWHVCRNKDRLPTALMQEIDVVHMRNRLPIFSSDRVGSDWDGEGEIGEPVP